MKSITRSLSIEAPAVANLGPQRRNASAQLTALLSKAGLTLRFDPRNSIMLCAICGAHAPRVPYRPFSIRLPWLGPSYSACSERCEWEAIGMRDGIGESD